MTRILIRCDASLSIGTGHVIRCRTLARALRLRGAEVLFLCRSQPGHLITLLETEFRVLVLPEQEIAVCERLEGRELYEAWLGCSQAQDAEDCLTALSSASVNSADWLVVDHYGLDATWQAHVQTGLSSDAPFKLLVIDDLADRTHQADLLLDQNLFGVDTHQRYKDLLPSHCLHLLGPHYALLGQEYAQLHPLVPFRTHLSRILVFFGGVDPDNLSCRALEALMAADFDHLAVDVVLGRHSPHRKAVEELAAKRKFTTLHSELPSLAGLIARADLAIGACGSTIWERACLKLPSLVVTIAANQRPFAKFLHEAGHLQLLGDVSTVSSEQIRTALLARISESSVRLHDAGGDLTDGFGASRLTLAMLGPEKVITLRPAHIGDEALLMRWGNDAQIRTNIWASNRIATFDQPHAFSQWLADSNRLLMIGTSVGGCPVGQICFERQELSANDVTGQVEVDLSLDHCVSGFGLEADFVRLGLQSIEQHWGPRIEDLLGGLANQRRGLACFNRAGFLREYVPPSMFTAFSSESLALPPSSITVLSDRGSWLNGYLSELILAMWKRGHSVRWIHQPVQLAAGDVCLMLSCSRLLSVDQLALHRHNLVVHASDLPHGQGWSPMTWQILEGASHIPITLFEATAELDAGPIYIQHQIELSGNELVEEWRALQAQVTLQLCSAWLDGYHEVVAGARLQNGESTYYRRRRPADSQLDPEHSLAEQFNLLRVVDNHHYPAFFNLYGRTFQIHVQGQNGGSY